ncbi:hypothetical protein, partial [Magnetococcus sp. PR-3]|uniref:hypothetical protein n=1 Tax=Magnetococcus sp. PR-3 TaxID=3120355 RepID=UPI002FCE3A4F
AEESEENLESVPHVQSEEGEEESMTEENVEEPQPTEEAPAQGGVDTEAVMLMAREIAEQMIREQLPELLEKIIREEVDKVRRGE